MNDRLNSIIARADRNRAEFERFCRSLSEEQLHRPIPESHWRVTDYIAHLATIDIWVGGEWFEAMARGTPWVPLSEDGGPFNVDEWNDARVNERRDASLDELFAEAAQTRATLYATFPRFTEETLASRFVFRGKEISFIDYLAAWTLHDPAHTVDMLRALPEIQAGPSIRAWLDTFSALSMQEVADVNANANTLRHVDAEGPAA